jgi:hypothetical protein
MEFPASAGNSIDQKQEVPRCRRPVFQTCNELVQTNQPDLVSGYEQQGKVIWQFALQRELPNNKESQVPLCRRPVFIRRSRSDRARKKEEWDFALTRNPIPQKSCFTLPKTNWY